MKNIIALIAIIVIIGLAVYCIIRQKKKGIKCIGCPAGGDCPSKLNGQCSANCHIKNR